MKEPEARGGDWAARPCLEPLEDRVLLSLLAPPAPALTAAGFARTLEPPDGAGNYREALERHDAPPDARAEESPRVEVPAALLWALDFLYAAGSLAEHSSARLELVPAVTPEREGPRAEGATTGAAHPHLLEPPPPRDVLPVRAPAARLTGDGRPPQVAPDDTPAAPAQPAAEGVGEVRLPDGGCAPRPAAEPAPEATPAARDALPLATLTVDLAALRREADAFFERLDQLARLDGAPRTVPRALLWVCGAAALALARRLVRQRSRTALPGDVVADAVGSLPENA